MNSSSPATMIRFEQKLRIPEDVLVQVVAGESVLLNLSDQCYYGLDATGTRIWEVLTSSDSVQAAYLALLGEFDVEPERLRSDLVQFVESLLAGGLLEIAGDKATRRGAGNE